LFGNIVWDRESLKFSLEKWKAVLKWAVGWQNGGIQITNNATES
jgi:hypothetical protein